MGSDVLQLYYVILDQILKSRKKCWKGYIELISARPTELEDYQTIFQTPSR